MTFPVKAPKKLIEVALPLDAINTEAALRKRKAPAGYPTTLHTWWAQRPLAAARAVIFAQLVNDPSWKWEMEHPGEVPPNNLKASWAASRKRFFALISDLVKWENTTNDVVLEKARAEIRKSWREVCELNKDHPEAATLFNPDKLPGLHDPFAGGGSIPLEAQRLGLDVIASDLNPVAVLINKAMIEIPPKFAGRPPVHPEARRKANLQTWKGAHGLAEDVRRYGAWMREEAERRIGHLYPKVTVTAEMAANRPDLRAYVGRDLTVVAWLWARTVKSPNPAYSQYEVPLVSTFVLSTKPGKESWVKPIVDASGTYRFEVRVGRPGDSASEGTKVPGRGANFRCLLSGTPIDGDYIKSEGMAGRLGVRLLATVAEGTRTRVYLSPTATAETAAGEVQPTWRPSGDIPARLTGGTCVPYGLREWADLFTPRQLVAVTTLADLVMEARDRARSDACAAGLLDEESSVASDNRSAAAYADGVATFLAFAVSRIADYGSSIATWRPKDSAMRATLGKQAIPMSWDFAEGSPFGKSSSGFTEAVRVVSRVLDFLPQKPGSGAAIQVAAQSKSGEASGTFFVSTDPPYYDNIAYADLSDFFYIWLRKSLRKAFPALFASMAVPKNEELVAAAYRHGTRENAERFFLEGMTSAMRRLTLAAHPQGPVTIYYAFKQAETRGETGTSSTGWETFLAAVLASGFSITGTWPVRTEGDNRQVGNNANALASSIVLVCRKRPEDAPTISRRQFIRELNAVLPEALDEMTRGAGEDQSPVAPVDLSQAIIGPGMAVFSKYAAVLEADGTPMTVKTALQLINRFLAEDDFDADTQFCLRWFEQLGWAEGAYGEADVLARAKATSVGGLNDAGVVASGSGKVRLLRWAEYPADWDPRQEKRLPVWEALHQLIRAFKTDGESGSGQILGAMKDKTEPIRQLAYRLYTLCERRGWAEDARAYNELVTSWSAVEAVASAVPETAKQLDLL